MYGMRWPGELAMHISATSSNTDLSLPTVLLRLAGLAEARDEWQVPTNGTLPTHSDAVNAN
jgi:hypothetical protein